MLKLGTQTDRQIDRQTDRQSGRQTDRQQKRGRQPDRQTDRHTGTSQDTNGWNRQGNNDNNNNNNDNTAFQHGLGACDDSVYCLPRRPRLSVTMRTDRRDARKGATDRQACLRPTDLTQSAP